MAKKSAEMNVSGIELFKKSKIIEIGSVEKMLALHEVGGFWKKSENPEIFVPEIWDSGPKTVPPNPPKPKKSSAKSENLEKHRLIVLSLFLRYQHNFWYTET